ncbi:MAG: phage holin family protein [Patescibacteria group bacterium]
MMLLLRWIVNALALIGIAYLVPNIQVESFYTALITALVLGILNAIVRPILTLLTLPITIMTLGLSTLFINALLFWFVSTFIKGFEVNGFVAAFTGAIIMWLVSLVSGFFLKR